MPDLLEGIVENLLMGPGPSSVYPSVYKAIARPTLGHLDPYFVRIMDGIKEQLQEVMGTANELTLPMSGSGSAGMEACFVNLIERGDRVLVLENGVFSKRMVDVASRLGANVDALEGEWGRAVDPQKVAEQLKKGPYAIVAMVHVETSTGVSNPVQAVGNLVRPSGALFLVDCVASLGGVPVRMDEWQVDAMYSGSQKCLSCPPGLAPLSFSQRAVDKLQSRGDKVPNWYFDLSMIINYWAGKTRVYHHTAPINMEYALYAGLKAVLDEGLPKVYARHARLRDKLAAGMESMGFSVLARPEDRAIPLSAFVLPEGAEEGKIRSALLKEHHIEIGGGLGPLAGKILRIGIMGHSARDENVDKVLAAIKTCL